MVASYPAVQRPAFKLNFYAQLTGHETPKPLTAIDLNPDVTSLTFETQWDIGNQSISAGYDWRRPNAITGIEETRSAALESDVSVPRFAHVELTDGGRTVAEGRITVRKLPGGRLASFTAIGYGGHAAKDRPYRSGDPRAVSGGDLLREAIEYAAPVLRIGPRFVDPGAPVYKRSDYDLKPPSDIIAAIVKDGNANDEQMAFTVYEDRKIALFPLVAPQTADYEIDFTSAVDWEDNADGAYGALWFKYSGGTQPKIYVTDTDIGIDFAAENGGLFRVTTIEGGTVSDLRAAKRARTLLRQLAHPSPAVTITTGGMSSGEVEGLRTPSGGMVAPWYVRAGQWVQVGDVKDGGGMFPIARTSFDASSLALHVELGQIAYGFQRTHLGMRQQLAILAQNASPATGAAWAAA